VRCPERSILAPRSIDAAAGIASYDNSGKAASDPSSLHAISAGTTRVAIWPGAVIVAAIAGIASSPTPSTDVRSQAMPSMPEASGVSYRK
jgi:hypothetical protein